VFVRMIEGRLQSMGESSPAAVAGRSVRELLHRLREPEDDGSAAPLEGYRVELSFSREVEGPSVEEGSSRTVIVTDRVSTVSDEDGAFVLTLGEGVEIKGDTATFAVSTPSGQRVSKTELAVSKLDEPVSLEIQPFTPLSLEEPADGELSSPLCRVSGRVFDPRGIPLPAGLQVVILARRAGSRADSASEHGVPVLVASLDRSGAFFGDVPNEEFVEAMAIVPGAAEPIPVPLENGRIAPKLLLKAEIDHPAGERQHPEPCDCGDGTVPRLPTQEDLALAPETFSLDLGAPGCVNFNKPNRAIEEFDFFSVIRTTEPEVRRLTLDGAGRLPQSGNGAGANGADADVALRAVSYDVRVDARLLDPEGMALRVSLLTADGKRHVVLQEIPPFGPGDVQDYPDQIEQYALEQLDPTSRSWSVAENKNGTDAIGLDLRSVKQIEVGGAGIHGGWALGGIGVSATTIDGDQVVIEIEGDEFHEEEPWLHAFLDTTGDVTWTANAGVATAPVAHAYAMRAAGPGYPTSTAALEPEIREAMREALLQPATGRTRLAPDTPVDWDPSPTLFQAGEVSHGHLLHFKQQWYANGYSLGDLLYSLPLAPGQKKLISVVDWERRERTERTETTSAQEGLDAITARDRDLGEVVTGALTESVRGGSRNTTTGAGVGTGGAGSGSYGGFNFGALLGVSGGYGESDSLAWQLSGKSISANSLQTLRDNTLQSASAVRSLRSTVVQTVSQGESTRVTTEAVANHNHCHALTIQYFEVLRHLQVLHSLVDVRECLFVPLPIAPFDLPKALRWRQSLEAYLQRRDLENAFEASRRVQTNWSEVDYPVKRYADEQVTSISGEFEVTILIPLPPLPQKPVPRPEDTLKATADALKEATNPTAGFLGVLTAIATGGASLIANQAISATEKATQAAMEGSRALAEELMAQTSPEAQYEKFQHEVMPGLAAGFVDQLELYALVRGDEVRIGSADFTLVSDYRPAIPLLASVKATLPPGIRRGDIQQLRIKSRNGLPAGCRVIVNTATLRYRTRLFEHALVEDRRANDDIDLPVVRVSFPDPLGVPTVTEAAAGQGAALTTPLDAWEQRNPRTEDRALSASLIEHLNEHLEYYHHALWWTMDPNRRYMLLDGFVAPNSGNRSIASVVENRLIGIVGNSLVLPVANGVHLDPRIQRDPKKAVLRSLYDTSPLPPANVCLPTRGVFAEAVMGECNACETIDDSKFWRWEQSPIDEPPAIQPASTETRRAEPSSTTPTTLPTPIVSIQNEPEVPSPAGVAAALDALGKQTFADITGLAGTQANAAAAYGKAMDTALAFGKEASSLAKQAAVLGARDRTMAAIDKAEAENKITPEEAKRLRTSTLEKSIGTDDGAPSTSEVTEKLRTIRGAEGDGAIDQPSAKGLAESVLKSYVGDETPPVAHERTAAADLIEELDPENVTRVETTGPDEDSTVVEASGGDGSPGGPFGIRGMVADILEGAAALSPLVAFDPDKPSAAANRAFARMVAADPDTQQQRQDDYVARFGFDAARALPIRGESIREPWLGISVADLDAVIKAAALVGTPPENVLAVWISEGKFAHNAMFRGGAETKPLAAESDSVDLTKVEDGPLRAFARSFVLWDTFGLDPLAAVARPPGQDTRVLGVDANHNRPFDDGVERIRTAGVNGPEGSSRTLRDYFTVLLGGLLVTREDKTISVRLRRNSHASWLWLQAALFDVVRRDAEQQLFGMYGAPVVDLKTRPWVTYLSWNIDSGERGAAKIAAVLGNFHDQEDAISQVFGDTPKKLSDRDIALYYAEPQSASALANAIIVKYLVESVRDWFA
jgi:hypothetical protein